jgi:hypothetical protein
MRTIITVLIFGVLILKGYGQTSERQHVFDETDTVYCGGLIDNAIRFTPSTNEINTADSLAEIHIKKKKGLPLGRKRYLTTNLTIASTWGT